MLWKLLNLRNLIEMVDLLVLRINFLKLNTKVQALKIIKGLTTVVISINRHGFIFRLKWRLIYGYWFNFVGDTLLNLPSFLIFLCVKILLGDILVKLDNLTRVFNTLRMTWYVLECSLHLLNLRLTVLTKLGKDFCGLFLA